MEHKKNSINRREFLKRMGAGAIVSSTALVGCDSRHNPLTGNSKDMREIPTDQMTYRTNHNTGDKVSLLGYGCMRWPFKQRADGEVEEIDQEAVNELVDYALAHGVNYFDTSPHYGRGQSEKATGIALSRHPRNSYYIATKMSTYLEEHGENSYKDSVDMYHRSMELLQTDYLDYYLIHGAGIGGMEVMNRRLIDNGMLDYLLKERKAGRIRNLGFSFHGEVEVFDYLLSRHDEIHWDFVQIQLNYADWKHASGWNTNAEYLYGELTKRNIPAVVMEPLLGGRLASLTDYLNARLKQRRPDDNIASWSFRYAGSFPNVLTVLSGMTYMEHLQDNIRTYSPLEAVSAEEFGLLERTAEELLKYPTIPCTTCEYCMPCPYGINIPAIFSHYNKCVNEGNVPASSKDEQYSEARRAFLIGYDRSVPRLRQASHCIGCGQCQPHCPQNIKIPQQLHRIDDFVEQLKQGLEF